MTWHKQKVQAKANLQTWHFSCYRAIIRDIREIKHCKPEVSN